VGTLDISTLENWLWEAACVIRGPVDAPKYKDYIISLIFYKRICDVYEDEIRKVVEELQISQDQTKKLVSKDRKLVRFYIPEECLRDNVRKVSEGIGERLTSALKEIARENFSRIITIEEARINDYNLSLSCYVSVDEKEEIQPIEDILIELEEVEEERES